MSAVKSAVSDDSTTLPAGFCEWSKRCFYRMPNLNDETKASITKASAWATWCGIFDQLNDQTVRGRNDTAKAAAASGKISVGLYALARAIGISPSTVRRQARRLEQIGLVVIRQDAVLHVHDPDTGKIVSKRQGRTPPCTIIVTVTDAHLRPFRRGAKCALSGTDKVQNAPPDKVQNAPPSKDSQKTSSRQRRPSDTSGVGRPDAAIAGRVTAAAPEPAQCRPFEGGHANAFAATQARLRAEQAARDAEDERLRHERLAARQASQDEPAATVPMTKGRAERELQAAVAALPAPSKAKARRAGRKIGASPQAADEDAKALQRAIDAKRAAEVYRDEPKAVGRVMAGSR
jgi:DNA-binding transcriptional ArsR family regulator